MTPENPFDERTEEPPKRPTRPSAFKRWQTRGNAPLSNTASFAVTVSALVALVLVGSEFIAERGLGRTDESPTGALETRIADAARQQGARVSLALVRVREVQQIAPDAPDQLSTLLNYVNALSLAHKLTQEGGLYIPDTPTLAAAADALSTGGGERDVLTLLALEDQRARIVALNHYYILLREGRASPSQARAFALQVARTE